MRQFPFLNLKDFLLTLNIELPILHEKHSIIIDLYLSRNTA